MSGATAISPAIDSFLSRAHQGEARSLLQRHGLPQRRLEAWRYTPLRELDKTGFAAPEAVSAEDARRSLLVWPLRRWKAIASFSSMALRSLP